MRIAVSKSGRWGGALTMAMMLARGLGAKGHDLLVLARPDSPLEQWADAEGVACVPALRHADFPLIANAACLRAFDRHDIDVLLSVRPLDLRFAAPAARIRGIPVVARAIASTPLGFRTPERLVTRWVRPWLVANSDATRESLLRAMPWLDAARVETIHNGIDAERIAAAGPADLGVRADAFAIGYVGRFDPEKGVLDLPAAWCRIARAVPEARLFMVGRGGLEPELRRGFGDDPRVHWLGYRGDVPAVMRALDLVVAPSHVEGFGLAAAEALAAGTPVVASHVGGLPEVVRDGVDGRLVPPREPRVLAEAVIALAKNADERRRMAENGRAGVRERFSMDRVVDRYEMLLERAAAMTAGGPARGRER